MTLPTFAQLNLSGSVVLLRGDLDVDFRSGGSIADTTRLDRLSETIKALLEKGVYKIVVVGHRGRPEGPDNAFSLFPLKAYFDSITQTDFLEHKPVDLLFETFDQISLSKNKIVLLENIRFYKEEEEGVDTFSEEISGFADFYVNEAFASSHRKHSSVYGVSKLFAKKGRAAFGINFSREVENLSKVFDGPRPIVVLISGAKEDKLKHLSGLTSFADQVLISGKLPQFLHEDSRTDPKLVVAQLNPDTEDITLKSMEKFSEIVASAGTIFLSGPMGKFEDEGHRQGTQTVLSAISSSSSLKIAGGGDTTEAIRMFGFEKSFDWISTGGGASLEFVALKTLPGIDAILTPNS
jgi:phosphoglycerate kinase